MEIEDKFNGHTTHLNIGQSFGVKVWEEYVENCINTTFVIYDERSWDAFVSLMNQHPYIENTMYKYDGENKKRPWRLMASWKRRSQEGGTLKGAFDLKKEKNTK